MILMSETKLQSYTALGKQIYDTSKAREAHRYYVFLLRSFIYRGKLNALQRHFFAPAVYEIAPAHR